MKKKTFAVFFPRRQDYQKYNEIQLSELEVYYQIKFESIENHFRGEEKEDIKPLIEENRHLEEKLSKYKREWN